MPLHSARAEQLQLRCTPRSDGLLSALVYVSSMCPCVFASSSRIAPHQLKLGLYDVVVGSRADADQHYRLASPFMTARPAMHSSASAAL